MAKFLAFRRATRQVVAVDTILPAITSVGTPIAGADVANSFPGRTENNICQFLGDYYCLYRSAANDINVALFDGANWNDVAGFTDIDALTPLGLHVVNDRLVLLATQSSAAPLQRQVIARRSAAGDGSTWDPPVTMSRTAVQSTGGASIVWHNVVWFTTADGLCYYDPSSDAFGASFDTAAGSGTEALNFGSFSFFNGDLYYAAPAFGSTATKLFKLDKSWSISVPTPVFVDTGVIIPTVGLVTVGPDAGNYALFVNKRGELTLFYSGNIGTKVVKILLAGSSYTVQDVTSTVLPSSLSGETGLGFGLFVDDRRSTNEQFTIIVRYRPAIPVAVLITRWDGSSLLETLGTLDDGGLGLDLMIPDEERSDFRVYTENQPSCFIDATTQTPPLGFPGRVRIDYTVRDDGSRPIDVLFQYSVDGQSWSNATEGDGDSGSTNLASSPTGSSYFFHWDAYQDLDGNYSHIDVRIVARISGV